MEKKKTRFVATQDVTIYEYGFAGYEWVMEDKLHFKKNESIVLEYPCDCEEVSVIREGTRVDCITLEQAGELILSGKIAPDQKPI